MTLRPLGRSPLRVSPIAFGGNVFGWTLDEARSFEMLDAYVARGGNFIDTADVYSRWVPGNAGGESEAIIGRWLKSRGHRDRLVIATKVGMEMGPGAKGLAPDYIRRSLEASLARLQTDYVDLYQSHVDDPDTPIEETLATYDQLIREGKVRHVGASNFTAPRLEESLRVSEAKGLPAYVSLQPHYNLLERAGFEAELGPLCQRHGVGVIPYFPLAAGFLSGKYRSEADLAKSPRGAGLNLRRYLDDRGLRVLGALDQVANRLGSTPATVAIAWLLAQPAITAPIASATSLAQLQSLFDAAALTLDGDALALLDRASAV